MGWLLTPCAHLYDFGNALTLRLIKHMQHATLYLHINICICINIRSVIRMLYMYIRNSYYTCYIVQIILFIESFNLRKSIYIGMKIRIITMSEQMRHVSYNN